MIEGIKELILPTCHSEFISESIICHCEGEARGNLKEPIVIHSPSSPLIGEGKSLH